MVGPLIPVIYSLLASLGHFFSERINSIFLKHKARLVSFSGGISTTYIFLQLLPDIYHYIFRSETLINRSLIVFVLVGFVSFHLFEKYIYRHATKKKLATELSNLHSVSFFIYHFLLGALILVITTENFLSGSLFFGVVFLHTLLSTASMDQIHKEFIKNQAFKMLLSASTLFGAAVALLVPVQAVVFYSALAFAAGIILHIVIRESLPTGGRGKPTYFVIGAALYAAVIISTWAL